MDWYRFEGALGRIFDGRWRLKCLGLEGCDWRVVDLGSCDWRRMVSQGLGVSGGVWLLERGGGRNGVGGNIIGF